MTAQRCRTTSTLISKNITVNGHRTSVRLEPDMWAALKEVTQREGRSLHEICSDIATRKQDQTSLTAAIRVYAMDYFRRAATEDGHRQAGHGSPPTAASAPYRNTAGSKSATAAA
jgi:predicted DNA-binding ribbon-helix-helix protein